MSQANQGLQGSGPVRSQREQQLRFESNVREFIGHEATAERPQALTIRGRFECSVVHDPDQLRADEYVYVELQTRESPYKTKHPIGPVGPLERDMMILHKCPKRRRVTLLLANE
jgi:hypothetical protein